MWLEQGRFRVGAGKVQGWNKGEMFALLALLAAKKDNISVLLCLEKNEIKNADTIIQF